jgi:hypothetical protein
MHPGYYVLQLELEFQLLLVSCSFNSSISVIFFAQLKINLDLIQINMNPPKTDGSGEPEFDSWWKQFLIRLYLPRGRTLDYRTLFA